MNHKDIVEPIVAINASGQKYEMNEAACTGEVRYGLKVHLTTPGCPRCFPMVYSRFHRKHARVEPLPTLLDWAKIKEKSRR